MLIIFLLFYSHVYYFQLKIFYNYKTITGFSLWFSPLEMYNKIIIRSVFVICQIINVSMARNVRQHFIIHLFQGAF